MVTRAVLDEKTYNSSSAASAATEATVRPGSMTNGHSAVASCGIDVMHEPMNRLTFLGPARCPAVIDAFYFRTSLKIHLVARTVGQLPMCASSVSG